MFGMKLKALMNSNGETCSSLARSLGVSRQSVMKWLERERPPKGDNVWKLAQHFKVSPEHFLNPQNTSDKKDANDLSPDEIALLRKYHGMNEQQKAALRAVADGMLPEHLTK